MIRSDLSFHLERPAITIPKSYKSAVDSRNQMKSRGILQQKSPIKSTLHRSVDYPQYSTPVNDFSFNYSESANFKPNDNISPVRMNPNTTPFDTSVNFSTLNSSNKLSNSKDFITKDINLSQYEPTYNQLNTNHDIFTNNSNESTKFNDDPLRHSYDSSVHSNRTTFRKPLDKDKISSPVLNSLTYEISANNINVADTSLCDGYSDMTQAYWVSQLRKNESNQFENGKCFLRHYYFYKNINSICYIDTSNLSNLTQPTSPKLSIYQHINKRQEKLKSKENHEKSIEKNKRLIEKKYKEYLRLQAYLVAQKHSATGYGNSALQAILDNSFDTSEGKYNEFQKRGKYIEKMIAKHMYESNDDIAKQTIQARHEYHRKHLVLGAANYVPAFKVDMPVNKSKRTYPLQSQASQLRLQKQLSSKRQTAGS